MTTKNNRFPGETTFDDLANLPSDDDTIREGFLVDTGVDEETENVTIYRRCENSVTFTSAEWDDLVAIIKNEW